MSDSPERQSQGHQELQDLISRNYPIGDLDVLELLDSLSEERGLMREAVGMWERAIATSSNKGKLSEVWFERKVLAGHWKYASKVKTLYHCSCGFAQTVRLFYPHSNIRRTDVDIFLAGSFVTISTHRPSQRHQRRKLQRK